jgi:hypothetical protein
MGSKGVLELTEFGLSHSPQPGIDLSPSYYSTSFPERLKKPYLEQWHKEHDPAPGKEPAPETVSFRGNDYDDLRPHLWNFFESVRSRKPLLQDAVFGHRAALGCHMANESYFRNQTVHWDAASGTIRVKAEFEQGLFDGADGEQEPLRQDDSEPVGAPVLGAIQEDEVIFRPDRSGRVKALLNFGLQKPGVSGKLLIKRNPAAKPGLSQHLPGRQSSCPPPARLRSGQRRARLATDA